MILNIFEMFSYEFIVKALLVGVSISICAALLGVSMVLKKNSMIGDGLSHVGFGAAAIASALNFAPLAFAMPIVILASILILKLTEKSKIHGDSAIAIIAASSLAIGYVVIHRTGTNNDIEGYLYGSIYGISLTEMIVALALSLIVILVFILLYHQIFAMTFDETFFKSTGSKTGIYSIIIAVLCSATVVVGMKIMGALLISSLIIFPSISSRQVFKTYKSVILSSVIISVVCFLIGLIINYYVDAPVGSTIVLINLAVLLVFIALGKILKR
jgi:zinc transport system permease protein